MPLTIQNLRLVGIVLTVGLLLLIPFTAMRFTTEVNWTLLDFSVAGTVLLTTGLLCELVTRKVSNIRYKILLWAAIFAGLVMVWGAMVAD